MAFLTPDKTYTVNGVTVKQFYLTEHNTNKISLPSKMTGDYVGVTIHNTDIIKVSGTTMSEQYTRATFNGNMNDVRVHYYVDDKEAWNGLPLTYQSWHAGQKGKADANGSNIGNSRTISIECIMGGKTGYEKAEDNAARLAAWLLAQKKLTIDNLYTHNYWCNVRNGKKGTVDQLNTLNDGYKGCPIYIRPHWAEFKDKVQKYMTASGSSQTAVQEPQKAASYFVQTGAFSSKENAEKHLAEVRKYFPNAYIKKG